MKMYLKWTSFDEFIVWISPINTYRCFLLSMAMRFDPNLDANRELSKVKFIFLPFGLKSAFGLKALLEKNFSNNCFFFGSCCPALDVQITDKQCHDGATDSDCTSIRNNNKFDKRVDYRYPAQEFIDKF